MMDLRSMAAVLGGVVQKGKRGPFVLCPGPEHSAEDRSLSVAPSRINPEGFVCISFASDAWQDCREHVRTRLGLPAFGRERIQPQRERPATPVSAPVSDSSASALRIWREVTHPDPRGTLAEHYLNQHRGLDLPDHLCERVVRFHARCPWEKERRPCMVTAFRSIVDDTLVAIQRTLLAEDGRKLGRRMLGTVAGAAIKIDDAADVEQGLTICEGFETGLAGRALGFRPVWALGSAQAIADFPVLPGIDALTILAETDDGGANALNARKCARKWVSAGQEAIIAIPGIPGDMNDLVMP